MINSYSLHKIDNEFSFSFDPIQYSKFKFGDLTIAESFGLALAKGFIEDVLVNVDLPKQIVVYASPYAFIPTATYFMKNHFVNYLNHWLVQKGKSVVEEGKIYRTSTYKEDYGNMDAEQRFKLIKNDKFYLDRNLTENKILFFLDDVKITGSHERMIKTTLDYYNIKEEYCMLYFAELIDKSIDPKIENVLNYNFVKSIQQVNDIIEQSNFSFNTRVVKYLLNSPQDEFEIFIKNKPNEFLKRFYFNAIGNKYHEIQEYKSNLSILEHNTFSTSKI